MCDDVASVFRALSYPTRLEILRELRAPRVLDEIKVGPGPSAGQGNPDRTLTRQGIRHHLDQLAEAGLVDVSRATRNQHAAYVYAASPERLFAASQALQELASIGKIHPLPSTNGHHPPPWTSSSQETHTGPRLVVVHGISPGTCFQLNGRDGSDRGWVIGRSDRADIALTHDPYAAEKHAEILPKDGGFALLDLRASDRPTYVDWEALPLGGASQLEPGSVVGIGRTLLVFRDS